MSYLDEAAVVRCGSPDDDSDFGWWLPKGMKTFGRLVMASSCAAGKDDRQRGDPAAGAGIMGELAIKCCCFSSKQTRLVLPLDHSGTKARSLFSLSIHSSFSVSQLGRVVICALSCSPRPIHSRMLLEQDQERESAPIVSCSSSSLLPFILLQHDRPEGFLSFELF